MALFVAPARVIRFRFTSLLLSQEAVWTHRAGCGKTNGKCNLMLTNVKQQTERGLSDAVVHT